MQRNSETANQKVLIVEDDQEIRTLLVEILEQASFEVDSASEGLDALEKLKQTVYDIVLTDLRLPGMEGEEIVCQARTRYPDLIIIVITGHGDITSAVNVM